MGPCKMYCMYGGGVNLFILQSVVRLPRLERRWQQRQSGKEETVFELRPSVWAVRNLARASGKLDGVEVAWTRRNASLTAWDLEMRVKLPPGAAADVYVPLVEGAAGMTTVIVEVEGELGGRRQVLHTCETAPCAKGSMTVRVEKKKLASWVVLRRGLLGDF